MTTTTQILRKHDAHKFAWDVSTCQSIAHDAFDADIPLARLIAAVVETGRPENGLTAQRIRRHYRIVSDLGADPLGDWHGRNV